MKKKYIALIVPAVLIIGIAFGSFLLFSNYKSFHVGHALISRSGEFIFVDEGGSPITMGDAAEKQFKGVTDGDKVLVLYGMVMTSYPGQSGTSLCIKLSDGTIDDVNKDTVKQLSELGWLKGEAPFENVKLNDIKSITISELSSKAEVLKEVPLSEEEIKTFMPLLNSIEFAHDDGEMYYGDCLKIEIELSDGKIQWFATPYGANSVQYNGNVYTATPAIGSVQDFAAEILDLNY